MKQHETFDIDLRQEAAENVLMQYQSDEQFMAWIDALIKPLEDLKRILLDSGRVFDIDKAQGVWLDKIGKLLVVSRRFCVMRLITPATPLFAFDDSTFAGKYGYWADSNTAGYWGDYPDLVTADIFQQQCRILDDFEYRKLIKAKIAKYYSRSTVEDIITSVRNIVGHDRFLLIEMPNGESMTLGIVFGSSLSQFDKDIFLYSDVSPRPAATRYDFVRELPNGRMFAFDDTTLDIFPHGFFDDDATPGYWVY